MGTELRRLGYLINDGCQVLKIYLLSSGGHVGGQDVVAAHGVAGDTTRQIRQAKSKGKWQK
jgi:hypothetical protein